MISRGSSPSCMLIRLVNGLLVRQAVSFLSKDLEHTSKSRSTRKSDPQATDVAVRYDPAATRVIGSAVSISNP